MCVSHGLQMSTVTMQFLLSVSPCTMCNFCFGKRSNATSVVSDHCRWWILRVLGARYSKSPDGLDLPGCASGLCFVPKGLAKTLRKHWNLKGLLTNNNLFSILRAIFCMVQYEGLVLGTVCATKHVGNSSRISNLMMDDIVREFLGTPYVVLLSDCNFHVKPLEVLLLNCA